MGSLLGAADVLATHYEEHPASLLCRVYGVYSMKLYSKTIYFVVLGNVYSAARGADPLLK